MEKIMLLLFLFGAISGASGAEGLVGDTYSCFSHFEQSESDSCQGKLSLGNGKYELEADPKSNTAFCVDGPVYGKAKQGRYEKSKDYIVSAELSSSWLEKYSNRYGFVGLAFNMEDAKNYDIAYVRPHTMDHCWEIGHVEDGVFYGKSWGQCEVKLDSDFSLAIKMEKGKATLYLNGVARSEFNAFFPSKNRIGTVLRNNMGAKMISKDLTVCYEIDCVSWVNGIVYTKPLQTLHTTDMKACEVESCGLYGQITRECKSMNVQGALQCTAPMIPVIGGDCCAKCAPAKGECDDNGDPHYTTLDGTGFDFQGNACEYCYLHTSDFEIRVKNKPTASAAGATQTEYALVLFDGDIYKMRSGGVDLQIQGGERKKVTTPWKKMYKTKDWIECSGATSCKIFLGGVEVISVTGGSGYIFVDIHGMYYERTSCFCGPWDGNKANDLTASNGVVMANDVNGFAQSWLRNTTDGEDNCEAPDPVDPCETREQRNSAEIFCSKFKRSPFKQCPVDVTPFYKDCMFDVCANPDGKDICDNAKAYVEACAVAGHDITDWRSSTFCPERCEESFVFDSCGGGCYPTCEDPNPECSERCIEGCYCPTGTVLQQDRCVDASECQCTWEGELKQTGEVWAANATCQECECMEGGLVECGPKTCDACPTGEIPIPVSGECCPECHADWAKEMIYNLTCMEGGGPIVMTCQLKEGVLVRPEQVQWRDMTTGEVMDSDNLPAGFSFDQYGGHLVLSLNPCELVNEGRYKAEVTYEGAVGTCDFTLNVIEKAVVEYIELVGDSPIVVKEGDCFTMEVAVITDNINFAAKDLSWTFGAGQSAVDFADSRISINGAGTIVMICDAVDSDEGRYTICATHPTATNQGYPITDCVDIEVTVLAVCELDDGSELVEGQNMTRGCATCVCDPDGTAVCGCNEQNTTCSEGFEQYFDEDCCTQCSRLPAVCSVTGDPHYVSFDGHKHDFQGACKFTMISTSDYTVNVRNEHRGAQKNVSWTREVEIIYQGISLTLGPEGAVTSDGQSLQLPYIHDWHSGHSLSVKKAGEKVIASIHITSTMEVLYLEWDGNSTSTATVHGKYYEGTGGLCGTWNENGADDQTMKGGAQEADLGTFGYSWKVEENGEVCEEAPIPPHPCENTWAADAAPIADAACDILDSAPFAECHALVDVSTAKYNCKFDVCSCYDSDCGCSAIKQYVQACLDAGVTSVQKWRDVATFCPLTCHSPYAYFICGSNCPASCADREPDCGRGGSKCNEGCFCPVGTFDQNGTCVTTDECVCLYNGETKEVGEQWYNEGTCKDCECKAAGDVKCVTRKCKKCSKQELPVRDNKEDCCNTCHANWLNATNPVMEDLELGTEAVISCDSYIPPKSVVWEFSSDGGATWTVIKNNGKGLTLTIGSVAASDAGQYKCTAKKNYRTASAITTVTVDAAASLCTVVAPENGAVTPSGDVPIGDTVVFSCVNEMALQGTYPFYMQGESSAVCQVDGTITAPVCVAKDKATVKATSKFKGNNLTLNCKVTDTDFKKGSVNFWYKDGDDWVQFKGTKYFVKTRLFALTIKNVKTSGTYRCMGDLDQKYVYEEINIVRNVKSKGKKRG